MELALTQRSEAGQTVVTVSGEVDLHSAPRLRQDLVELVEQGEPRIVLDLGAVGFLDSTGLGVLVAVRTMAIQRGGILALVCTQDRILKLFAITGLDGVFVVYPTVEQALRAVTG